MTKKLKNFRHSISSFTRRHPLAFDISCVSVIKVTLLILAGIFLFGSDHRVKVNEHVAFRHFFEQPAPQ
ncbi:MAG: hypothetical protein WAO98_05575 [Alphaproteobacteria bacterium]